MSGADMLINSVLKALKLEPEAVKTQIANIAQIAVNLKAQLDRIEHKQNLICEKLGIPPDDGKKEIEHG